MCQNSIIFLYLQAELYAQEFMSKTKSKERDDSEYEIKEVPKSSYSPKSFRTRFNTLSFSGS